MSDWTVRRRGTDSSGRGIYASDYMWAWWESVLADPALREFAHLIVITQGAWMSVVGGGAKGSAGYHDGGGCFDLRVWNLTDDQVTILIRVLRRHGAAAWLRNLLHGGFSDPHIHLVLGTDFDLDDGAAYQWRDYVSNNGDGMGGRDYHWRPSPIITTPPEVDPMAQYEAELAAIQRNTEATLRIVQGERERGQRQTKRVMDRLSVLAEKGATKAQLRALRDELRDELAAMAAGEDDQ